MRKITLLIALVAFCSFAFAQTKFPVTNNTAQKSTATPSNIHPKYTGKVSSVPINIAKQAVGDTIWSEDFSGGIPSGWTLVDNTGNGYDWVLNSAAITGDFTSTGVIASTSGGNHMLLFGDLYNTGGTGNDMDAYFQTDAIDLSSYGSVEVEFQQKFRVCCAADATLSLFVSNDNSTWTEFDTDGGVAVNDQSADPVVVTVDITCIAAGQSTVYLRWHKMGASHYYWMIDDILLREVAITYDLAIGDNFYLDPWLTPPYSMVPVAQIDTSMFAAVISNTKLGTETGVTLNVTVNDGTNDVFNSNSAPVTINGCLDSTFIDLTNGWLTNNIGTYSITMEVSSDSTDVDPSNNSVTQNIDVTDTVFARDNGAPIFELHAAAYGVTQPYEFGVWYEIPNAETATSVSVQLGPSTIVGTVIQGKIYAGDLTTVLESTGFYTVASGDPGNWVTIGLNAPLALAAQNNLLVSIAEFGSNDTAMTIQATNTIDQPFATSWLFYGGGQQTPIVEVPFIRLNVGPPSQTCNLTATVPVFTEVSCNGSSDGAISGIVPSGGTAPYTYLWTPGGHTQADTSMLPAGVYDLAITDANGCVYNLAADVPEPDALTVDPTVIDITCNGAGDGNVIAGATGGNLSGTPAVVHFSEDFQGVTTPALPGGFTTATLGTDAGFITGDATDANAAGFWPVPAHGVFAQTNDDLCNCDKSADYLTLPVLDFTGLAGVEFNFSIYDDGQYGQLPTEVELSVNGGTWTSIYTVTIGTSWQDITVALPGSTDNQSSVQLRFFYNDGGNWATGVAVDDISVETPAIPSAYVYSFDGGAYSTTSNFTGLAVGSYSLKVMDASGCEDSTTVTIAEPTAMVLAFSQTTAACGLGGSATVGVTGGVAPYMYLWDDGSAQTTATASNLVSDQYTCTVTDTIGCVATVTDSVQGTPPITITMSNIDPSACGLLDGSAIVTIVTGTAPYNYTWDDPGTQGTDTATGLAAGIYTVSIIDIIGCTASGSITLTDPGAPTITTTPTHVSCMGGTDGSILASAFSGTAPYTYTWGTSPVQTGVTASGLGAGIYSIHVVDAGGCSSFDSDTITEPGTAFTIDAVTVTNVSCNGDADGSLTASASGGTGSPTYAWNGGPSSATYGSLSGGTYTVVAMDANLCADSATATVTEPTALAASASNTDITCNGDGDGSVTTTVSGGSGTYTYLWTPGGAGTADLTGLGGGFYSVVVTDSSGCNILASATVAEPTALTTSIDSYSDESGINLNDGAITASASGGTTPYSPFWSGPNSFTSTSLTLTNLEPGTYQLTLNDANGCPTTLLTQVIAEVPDTIGIVDLVNNVEFRVYPNPNTGQFIVELNKLNNEEYQIEIRNIIGQLVLTENVSELNGNFYKSIDLSAKETGIYFISLIGEEGKITKKLVVY